MAAACDIHSEESTHNAVYSFICASSDSFWLFSGLYLLDPFTKSLTPNDIRLDPLAAAVIRILGRIFSRRKFTAHAVRRQIFLRLKSAENFMAQYDDALKYSTVSALFTTIITLSQFPIDALNTSFELNC